MFTSKLNKLINLINQSKVLKKNYFFILKTPQLDKFLNIFQEERCIQFYKIITKEDNKTYYQVFLNLNIDYQLINLVSNFQQYFFKIKFLKIFLASNIRLKVYLNTKKGLLRDVDAVTKKVGGVLLFGIKYL